MDAWNAGSTLQQGMVFLTEPHVMCPRAAHAVAEAIEDEFPHVAVDTTKYCNLVQTRLMVVLFSAAASRDE